MQLYQSELINQPEKIKFKSRFGDEYRNNYGCLRVGMVRRHLSAHFNIDDICAAYSEWVETDEWLKVLRTQKLTSGNYREDILYLKAIKRGDDEYQNRINQKIAAMGDFNKMNLDATGSRSNLKTRVLFVTLSYDTKRFSEFKHPQMKAWQSIGVEFNKWISAIRQKYGKVDYFRVWEATKDAWPHVHLILVFEKHQFDGFMHRAKDKNWKLRIRGKKTFERCWHSYVDVQGILKFKRGMSELLKYLKKSVSQEKENKKSAFLNSKKGLMTLALNWIFNNQQFSISSTTERECLYCGTMWTNGKKDCPECWKHSEVGTMSCPNCEDRKEKGIVGKCSSQRNRVGYLAPCVSEKQVGMDAIITKRTGFFAVLITDLHNSNIWVEMQHIFQQDLLNSEVVSTTYELLDIVPWNSEGIG